jgi:hypothetical protein
LALYIYAVTLFAITFLLLLVQPIVAKMILPRLGDAHPVWNTLMMYMGTAQLVGYVYTHAISILLPYRAQFLLHLALAAFPLFFLPFSIGGWVPPTAGSIVSSLLVVVLPAVLLPVFVLSSSTPLLQKWFTQTTSPSSKDPYFLYSLSNFGGLLSVLIYPLMIEPRLALREQSWWWSLGYGLVFGLTLLCATSLWFALPGVASATGEETEAVSSILPSSSPGQESVIAPANQARQSGGSGLDVPTSVTTAVAPPKQLTILCRLRWVVLAAVPAPLLLGLTTSLNGPLVWTIPLALYFLSLALVFMKWPIEWTDWPRRIMLVSYPLGLVLLAVLLVVHVINPTWSSIWIYLIAFFITALVCHGELARHRPPTRNLTAYYLWMLVGEMIGSASYSSMYLFVFGGM